MNKLTECSVADCVGHSYSFLLQETVDGDVLFRGLCPYHTQVGRLVGWTVTVIPEVVSAA